MKITKLIAEATAVAAFVAAFGLGGSSAFAATKTWTGADCDKSGVNDCSWSDINNWSDGAAPVDGDSLMFNVSVSTGGLLAEDGTVFLQSQNDIAKLNIFDINVVGSGELRIVVSPKLSAKPELTLSGNIKAASTITYFAFSPGNIILNSDSSWTNVSDNNTVGLDAANTLNLNGHTLTIEPYTNSPLTVNLGAKITGDGGVVYNGGSATTVFLNTANDYTGKTDVITGRHQTIADVTDTIFGTSDITVGSAGSLNLSATEEPTWVFSNRITIQPANVNAEMSFTNSQLYIWSAAEKQTIKIPNITLQGNAMFNLNDLRGGVKVDLTGIQANGHCVQYGSDNNQASSFINGPAGCVIGSTKVAAASDVNCKELKANWVKNKGGSKQDELSLVKFCGGVPDTGKGFIAQNPVTVAVVGLAIAGIAFVLLRMHGIKGHKLGK